MADPFDLIVIGAGPGGYVAAIRAAQLGMRVGCVEREFLGGTCLNIGCIPSKALLDSSHRLYEAQHRLDRHGININQVSVDLNRMMARKTEVVNALTGGVGFLFKKNKVEHLKGNGRITAPGTVEVEDRAANTKTAYKAKNILIATGSVPTPIPSLPFDSKFILSSTEALSLTEVPKRLLVIGAGYIGLEMGSVWSRLGSAVTVLEFLDRALPASDAEMALALQKSLEKQGLNFRFKTAAQSVRIENGQAAVTWKSGDQTGQETADRVLVAVGRKPMTDNLGLASVQIVVDKKGFIPVDDHYRTTAPGVWAIGDVIGGLMLAHKAEEEGVAAVEIMAGRAGHVNYSTCPAIVYTYPELASVGMTEAEAAARGPIRVGKFPLSANGRARAMDDTEGFVKIIADDKTDRILGVHILAGHASDMIEEAVVAMEFASTADDLARCFHGHPTLSEAVKEAALAVGKRAIHI
jgi:dihydrolipoamide dehydrogenase